MNFKKIIFIFIYLTGTESQRERSQRSILQLWFIPKCLQELQLYQVEARRSRFPHGWQGPTQALEPSSVVPQDALSTTWTGSIGARTHISTKMRDAGLASSGPPLCGTTSGPYPCTKCKCDML